MPEKSEIRVEFCRVTMKELFRFSFIDDVDASDTEMIASYTDKETGVRYDEAVLDRFLQFLTNFVECHLSSRRMVCCEVLSSVIIMNNPM